MALSALITWAPRSAVVSPTPARTCLVSSTSSRTCVVSPTPVRTLSVTQASRSVVLSLRGVTVAAYSIYQSDTAPALDIQLLGDGTPVSLAAITSVVGEWTFETGATGTLSMSVTDASQGRVRHTWAAGETAALTAGNYALRVTVTFLAGSVTSYPDANQAPISLRIVR